MFKNKSTPFLRALNTKIFIYFITFAFAPLLVFSIIGFYMNKDLITRTNHDNLTEINLRVAHEIQNYFQFKEKLSNQNLNLIQLQRLLKDNSYRISHEILFKESKKKLSTKEFEFVESDINKYLDRQKKEGQYLLVSSEISNGKILVISKIESSYIYEDLMSFKLKIIFINIILVLILSIFAFVYSKHISNPILKLIDAVKNIRLGNLNGKIELATNDEIQTLAEEFELMREKLQESYKDLEEKIVSSTMELKEAHSQISHQEKMASLGLMAAGIAHEIGNPLTSISSMTQVIKRRLNDPEIVEFLNNILKNIDRISHIVRELVGFSRPSNQAASIVNINEIIKSAVGIVKYDKRSKHIYLNLEMDKNLPQTYLVQDHLLQVLINILINAVDASENLNNEINVSSIFLKNFIEIEIEDKGCGIEKDQLNKIFEPFFTTKEVGKGTGLGLTVSYGIVEKFGGEIKVKSKPGKGSIFTIRLPILKEEK